ncbi:MAG TPA: DUF927 domain-containing protein [Selenomonadales bacterium]|nr:DUF927 domain-containing protein [Selenomonadales bacterium]
MDIIQFLSTIFQYAETGYTQVFALPSAAARAIPVSDFSAVPAAIAAAGQQDIYFSPGISGQAKNSKLSDPDIIGIPALWADVDIFSPAHAAPNLPRTVQEAMTLVPDCLPPSIVVHSGHGLQFWWLLKEPWMFDTPEEKQRAQGILTRLQKWLLQRGQANGWKVDSVQDLCRVMRLPGTLNVKIPTEPVLAQVIEQCDIRYDPAEIDELLPAMEQAAATRQRQAAFERRPTDGPVEYMLRNCIFLQNWQLNYKTMPEPEWVAAIANAVRGVGGEEFSVELIRTWLGEKFDADKTMKKIRHIMEDFKGPYSCDYIRTALGFQGCPPGGCGMQAPCGWSLGKLPQIRARVKSHTILTPEIVYTQEFLADAAILEKELPAEYDMLYQRLPVNKNTFRKELAKFKREQSGLTVIDGGAPDAPAPAADGSIWLQSIIPDIPLNLRVPGSGSSAAWVVRQNGINLKRVTNFGESYQLASYVPVIIAERIYNIDTQQEKAVVVFRGPRGGWRSATLPKSTIFDARRIMCLSDAMLTINGEMAKNLTKWLTALEAANMDIIPLSQGVGKMGWRNQDQVFILPGISSDYKIDIGEAAAESAVAGLGQAGDFAVWLETMRQLRTRTKARFIMAASFAAPLLKIVGQRSFLIHNWDTTRGGKSATLMAALSVWGNPEELSKSFEDSRTNTERTAALFTDLPLGINEYEILNDKQKGEVESKIYQISEGKGKGRATRDGLQTTVRWRTIALMTGETQITRQNTRGGVFTRLIEVKGGPLADDDIFASSLYPLTARHYGHAGKLFVEQLLATNHDWLRDVYHKTRVALRGKYTDKIESHMDAIACIVVAEYLASYWIFGIPDAQAKVEAIAMAEAIIQEIITKTEASEAERAWDWLPDWLAANESRFGLYSKNGHEVWGYTEDDYFFIIKSEIAKAMKAEGFNADKIFKQWADSGKIPVTIQGGKRVLGVRGKRMNGVQPWLIRICI